MKKEFTPEQKQEIIEKAKLSYRVVEKPKLQLYEGSSYIAINKTGKMYRCSCKDAQCKPLQPVAKRCIYCGEDQQLSAPTLATEKSIIEALNKKQNHFATLKTFRKLYPSDMRQEVKLEPIYVFEFDKNDENLLYIYRCTGKTKIDDDGSSGIDINIASITEIRAGKRIKCYLNEEKKKEVDSFKALSISSKLSSRKVVMLGYKDLQNALSVHKEFAKISGAQDFLNLQRYQQKTSPIVYFALIAKYPLIEQLMKMGYTSLVKDIFFEVENGGNITEINNYEKKIASLFNEEETRGSKALKIPKYLADYLISERGEINDFQNMIDIYQMDKTLTKENFQSLQEKKYFKVLVNSLCGILSYFGDLSSIMTYGYKLDELLSYLYKQNNEEDMLDWHITDNYSYLMDLLYDYNHMCDILQIKPQKFPKDLPKVHNALFKSFKEYKSSLADEHISAVKEKYEKVAIDLSVSPESKYVISLPASSKDLIEEGTNQHNCVGSYIQQVANRESVVFFIRKKEEPQQSYVTAEYKRGKVNQLYYSNNRPVRDKEINMLAENFVKGAIRIDQKAKSPS